MKQNVCDICYYEGKKQQPILAIAKFSISQKQGHIRLKLDTCEKHKTFLRDREGKSIQDIEKELFERQTKFYKG